MIFDKNSSTAGLQDNKYKCKGPLKYYLLESDETLIFHVLNVGQGLMILMIFPDKTTMLFDCYITNDTQEEIIKYLKENIPIRRNKEEIDEQWIDIFVNSHRDQDHYRGLKSVNNIFQIKSIWDSGQYGTGAASGNEHYKYYMYLKRKLKKDYGDEAVPVLEPSNTPFRIFGETKVYCLNSKEDFIEGNSGGITESLFSLSNYDEGYAGELMETLMKSETKDQHTNCIVLQVEYRGKRIFLTGDSDWKSWKESIVPNFKDYNLMKTDILVASHHGSRSFFTDEKLNEDIDIDKNPNTTYIEHIEYIDPTITVISCGEYSTYHHPNESALKIYRDNTKNQQVYTTNEKGAGFIGFIKSNSFWGLMSSIFLDKKSHPDIEFVLECEGEKNGITSSIVSGQSISTQTKLKFKAYSIRGIADNLIKEHVKVTWEVSNSGSNADEEHQEIYYAGKDEKKAMYISEMKRDLMYDGIHLLRCTIENKDRNRVITKVFKVEGVN